jgi:hypothetical protein
MKSAWRWETQKARVRVPPRLSSCSRAFRARDWVATWRVSSSSSKRNALHEVAAVDEVLLAQGEEVAPVGAFRGGSEAEQELRAEVVDEAPVSRGRGVVELVHDDVVEGVAREALEVGGAAEGLDRREEDVGVWLPLVAHVEAQSGVGPDPSEGVPGLLQDLLAMRNEEDVAELGAVGVEGPPAGWGGVWGSWRAQPAPRSGLAPISSRVIRSPAGKQKGQAAGVVIVLGPTWPPVG